MTDFERIGQEVGQLVAAKNQAYGSSFARSGEIMRILYPQGIAHDKMDDALAVVRIVDKLFRIASATRGDPMGESPFKDVMGYGLLGLERHERLAKQDAAEARLVRRGELGELGEE